MGWRVANHQRDIEYKVQGQSGKTIYRCNYCKRRLHFDNFAWGKCQCPKQACKDKFDDEKAMRVIAK